MPSYHGLTLGLGLIKAANAQVKAITDAANTELDAMRDSTDTEINATREAAERQVAAVRSQIDAEHLPFLIEVLPSGPVFPDMGARDNPNIAAGSPRRWVTQTIALVFDRARPPEEVDPRDLIVRIENGMAFISLPLRNVGRGLAIVDEARIEVSGLPWLGRLKAIPRAQPERVPVGETTRLYVISEFHGVTKMTEKDRWQLRVSYRDFACRQPVVVEILIGYRGDAAATGDWFISSVRHASRRDDIGT